MFLRALQWGRVVKDAEIEVGCAFPDVGRLASMGPRRERRGNIGPNQAAQAARQASMGPRRERRGNRARTMSRETWSRGFNGAAS